MTTIVSPLAEFSSRLSCSCATCRSPPLTLPVLWLPWMLVDYPAPAPSDEFHNEMQA